MNRQKETPAQVLEVFKDNNVQYMDIDYYAWPQIFGSTSGPSNRPGGSSMSCFTVEAYVCAPCGPTVYVCCGMFAFKDERFEPFKKISGWRKLPSRKKVPQIF